MLPASDAYTDGDCPSKKAGRLEGGLAYENVPKNPLLGRDRLHPCLDQLHQRRILCPRLPFGHPVAATSIDRGWYERDILRGRFQNLSLPQWSLLDAANTSSAGTLSAVSFPANSILYTAPVTPPIYTFTTPTGITQGDCSSPKQLARCQRLGHPCSPRQAFATLYLPACG